MTNEGSAEPSRLDSLRNSVKEFVDQNTDRVQHFKTRVVEVKHDAVAKANTYLDRTSELIKAHPFRAIAIAFGIGYVGMRLFRRSP